MTHRDSHPRLRVKGPWRLLQLALRTPGGDRVALLDARLRRTTAGLGGMSGRELLDRSMMRVLLGLYDESDPERVWECFVAPFVDEYRDDLQVIYARDRRLPSPLLARPEGLLVLERLQHAPAQLAESWPGPQIELERVARNWAVAI